MSWFKRNEDRLNYLLSRNTIPVNTLHTSTITQVRAPTDESVRLLHELEQAARNELLNSIKVGDTIFECVVHCGKDVASGDIYLRAIFSLNGKRITVDRTENYFDISHSSNKMTDLIYNLRQAMAERIAAEILIPVLDQIKW